MDFDSTFASINSFGGVDFAPHNKGITPVFFIEPVLDNAATEREGRTVYRDMERVRIYIAGDSLSAATHPVDDTIRRRFQDQYEAWKRKKSDSHINGMPLSKWPMATPSMIRELESLNIYSVEDLAAVADANIHNVTDGRAVREKAIAWLKSAVDGAAVMRYAAEAQRLRDEVAQLRKIVDNIGVDSIRNESREGSVFSSKKRAPMKDRRRTAWTDERRKAASEAAKARRGNAAVAPPMLGHE